MCTFQITNNSTQNINHNILQPGGPDLSNTIKLDDVYITHHLLSITGDFTPQPVEREGKHFLLMGEIYNYDKSLPSDIYFGIEKYFEYGDKFTEHLDGEFLFIVIDGNTIDFFSDPWSTRQAYYTILDDKWYFTTLRISPNSQRFLHNSHYRFHTKDTTIELVNDELTSWNLEQNINSLDEVVNSFEEAVIKRWTPNSTLFLSGGVDSSAVALCLHKNKKTFNAISLMIKPEHEDQESLSAVVELCKPPYYNINEITDEYLDLDNSQCEIRKQTKLRFNSKVVLTGSGSDEFIDNYISKNISEFYVWPNNLNDIFPYSHFYKGSSRLLLDFHERYSLNFGIENRNTFYDKKFVQCWLNTTPEIKNDESKAFLKDYIREYNIPISKFPRSGFGRQNSQRPKNRLFHFYSKTIFLGENNE
jgi:asparagine synthetase B (glutamine-hydrolysing)|tara:strand:- start:137 stop:1390 length:1254 start_codon:yes stop_codon:yes gene_type:complete